MSLRCGPRFATTAVVAAIDVAILAAFVAYAVASGLRSRAIASRDLNEYFLAGRSLPGWKAGLSMAATQFAADTPLLVTGLIATAGIFALWRLWIYALAFLLLGFVLAPGWRRAGVLTDAELTEVRYGRRPALVLRGVKAIYFGTLFNCTVLAWVLLAAARIAEPFLLWDAWLPEGVFQPVVSLVRAVGVPLASDPSAADVWVRTACNLLSIGAIVVVTAFYSATGGLRSVVNTDVAQLALMMIGTLLFAWIAVDRAGGLGALPDAIAARFAGGGPGGIAPDEILAFTPSVARDAPLSLLAVFAIQWLAQMNSDGTGYLAQRTMACRTDRDAKQAALVFTVTQVLVRSLLWIPLGLALLLLFPPDPALAGDALRADREGSYVRGMVELLPPGARGLMLTAMLAALASTVDTHLNWGASYWTNDIYKRFVCQMWRGRDPSPRALVWVARASNVGILAIALVIMSQLGSIATAWETSLLFGAGMGGVLVLRWLWWRITAWGELAAIAASLVLAPALLLGVDSEAARLLAMAAVSTAAAVGVSLALGPEDLGKLRSFYRVTRPPGFWSAVSDDPRGDRRRLARGVAGMALAALSIFCLLTALGSLLAGSPPPAWFPYRAAWLAVLAVVGVALVPVWWRLAFGRNATCNSDVGRDGRSVDTGV